jgi:hypothetical protein
VSSSGDPDVRPSSLSGRTAWARSLETPLREFLRTETGGAAVLLAAAVAALVAVAALLFTAISPTRTFQAI